MINTLISIATLSADLEVKTGLHIGAGKDVIEIGGIDNPIIKTLTGDPYVPGSSIKGRMRFLLEWAFGKVRNDGKVWGFGEDDCKDPRDPVLRIFGTNAKRSAWNAGPTRLLVRDAMLCKKWREQELDAGRELTEEKTEVVIDRIAGKALEGVGPRHTERVPPGSRFKFEASFRIYSVDGDEGACDIDCLAWVIQGLDLIEQDALGGSGSRGYGRVVFRNLKLKAPNGEIAQFDNVFRNHPFDHLNPVNEIRELVVKTVGKP